MSFRCNCVHGGIRYRGFFLTVGSDINEATIRVELEPLITDKSSWLGFFWQVL